MIGTAPGARPCISSLYNPTFADILLHVPHAPPLEPLHPTPPIHFHSRIRHPGPHIPVHTQQHNKSNEPRNVPFGLRDTTARNAVKISSSGSHSSSTAHNEHAPSRPPPAPHHRPFHPSRAALNLSSTSRPLSTPAVGSHGLATAKMWWCSEWAGGVRGAGSGRRGGDRGSGFEVVRLVVAGALEECAGRSRGQSTCSSVGARGIVARRVGMRVLVPGL